METIQYVHNPFLVLNNQDLLHLFKGALMLENGADLVTVKGPFKYYVSMFLAFLGPTTYVSINSNVNQQNLQFSDTTHPPLC